MADSGVVSATGLTPTGAYEAGVADGRWQADAAQRAVLPILDRIHGELSRAAHRPGWLRRLFRRAPATAHRGLYLWGGVGRGKTFLVDLLADSLPAGIARRRHFHRFMGEVHAQIRLLGHRRDPLAAVADEVAGHCRLLCLDEFIVLDIGDAMILGRLLRALFARGVVLATTSNTPPRELYRDGLQRARFLPAIALLERQCEIVELASPTDYRLRALTRAPVYLVPADAAADAALRRFLLELAPGACEFGGTLEIEGRPLQARAVGDGVAWFDFAELCEGPRAAADYIELARSFNTVLISGVPVFGAPGRDDAAKRFIHLVDEFYDRRVKLLLSAQAPADGLYRAGPLRAQFERTESRLIEMQSTDYLAEEHRA